MIDRNIFNNFIEDISILNRLGLSVVVVHGGGPRIEKKLKEQNIQTKFINGLRVTDKKVISIVEEVLIDFNKDIVDSLKKRFTSSVNYLVKNKNVINVVPDNKELGFVGIPDLIEIELLKDIINKEQIPVIAPLGVDKDKIKRITLMVTRLQVQ